MARGVDQLTAREEAVLAAVERRLGNADIASELHISVRTVESHVAALRRKLAVDSRAGLVAAARARRGRALPVPTGSFVGRDADLDAVRQLLTLERWVTVVGPAGCGKTRLAVELAARGDRVPLVVDLAHATPEDAVSVVAKSVGLGSDASDDPVSATAMALGAHSYLLVLDNCDRVGDVVGDLVVELLRAVGSLRVVATSRSPLGGPGEAVHPLAPLAVDGPEPAAVQLFADRAAAAGTELRSADDLRLAGEVCVRLDGLPLAIELAAARTRHLPLGELSARLAQGFGALDRGGVGRHSTLSAAFAWTWDLLDPREQDVLVRLAALPRTFDLDLAEAVAGPGAAVVALRLVDRSLVVPVPSGAPSARFRLLEPVRDFALERAESSLVPAVRELHAEHHRALAAALGARARTDDSPAAAETAAFLCPEVNAAVEWSLDTAADRAVELATVLAIGGEQYGPDLASLRSIARVAADPRARAVATAEQLLDLGLALSYLDLGLMSDVARLSRERSDGSPRDRLLVEHLAGCAAAYNHDAVTALRHLDAAELLADEQLDVWQLGHVRQMRGLAHRDLGDLQAAMADFESAMRTFELAGDAMHVNNARYMMAAHAVPAGRSPEQALEWAEQCVEYSRRSGHRHELAHAVLTRSALLPRSQVEEDLRGVVEVFTSVGDLRCLARSHLRLADEQPAAAAAGWLELALAVARRTGDVVHQQTALERLVATQWGAGAVGAAAGWFGALAGLVGDDEARALCPTELVEALPDWPVEVARGRASVAGAPAVRAG